LQKWEVNFAFGLLGLGIGELCGTLSQLFLPQGYIGGLLVGGVCVMFALPAMFKWFRRQEK
jgi:amino acid transporter